jgi:hypothetical protein
MTLAVFLVSPVGSHMTLVVFLVSPVGSQYDLGGVPCLARRAPV